MPERIYPTLAEVIEIITASVRKKKKDEDIDHDALIAFATMKWGGIKPQGIVRGTIHSWAQEFLRQRISTCPSDGRRVRWTDKHSGG